MHSVERFLCASLLLCCCCTCICTCTCTCTRFSNTPPTAMAQQENTQLDSTGSNDEKYCQHCSEAYPLRCFKRSKSAPGGRVPLCYRCHWEVTSHKARRQATRCVQMP